jgi:hypothetical protein
VKEKSPYYIENNLHSLRYGIAFLRKHTLNINRSFLLFK